MSETFLHRLFILLAVLTIAAAIDKMVHAKQARRWKEYLVLLGGGGLFALFGFVHDQVTVTISPAYYELGKGIFGENQRMMAGLLGLQTGFVAGVILTGVFLVTANWPLKPATIFRYLRLLAICAGVCALIGSVAGVFLLPNAWIDYYAPTVDEEPRFRLVMGEHYGVYLGAVVGCLGHVWKSYATRKSAL